MCILAVYLVFAAITIKSADVPLILSGMLGLYLLVCAYAAIGLFMSSITSYQVVAAMGTLAGGPIGDKIGRKYVIWGSILGAAPFSLLMPHVGFVWTIVLSFCVGLVLSSAFPAILLYAQELLPYKLGLISGLFFGFAFGVAGIASAVLGNMADHYGIEAVYNVCGFMPLLGLVTWFLPNLKKK